MSDALDALARLSEVDDCWNRIGVRGDKTCERLAEHVHCRNCPVHAAAANRLLDRLALPAGPMRDAPKDGPPRAPKWPSQARRRRSWCSAWAKNGWACPPGQPGGSGADEPAPS